MTALKLSVLQVLFFGRGGIEAAWCNAFENIYFKIFVEYKFSSETRDVSRLRNGLSISIINRYFPSTDIFQVFSDEINLFTCSSYYAPTSNVKSKLQRQLIPTLRDTQSNKPIILKITPSLSPPIKIIPEESILQPQRVVQPLSLLPR